MSKEDPRPQLIAAWRRTRHPRLAELTEILDDQAPARPALTASKKRAELEAWWAVEALGDALDFARLMAGAGGGTQDNIIRQIKALARREHPGLARGLLRLLAKPPYAGVKSRDMLTEILGALEATRDCRVPAQARALAARYLSVVNSSTGGWMVDKLQALAQRMPSAAPAPLDGDDERLCATLEATVPEALAERRATAAELARAGATFDALLAAVYAAPDDDGPRLVFADALLERGEARGEFITLQIARARGTQTPEQAKRERELLGNSSRLAEWAQPLSNGGACTFARGFPARVYVFARAVGKLVGDPAWATVNALTSLEQMSIKGLSALLRHPSSAGVRELRGMTSSAFAALADRSWPWTTLHLCDGDKLTAAQFAAAPALRHLGVHFRRAVASPELFAGLRVESLSLFADTALPPLSLPPALHTLRFDLATSLWPGALRGLVLRSLALRLRGEPASPSTLDDVAALDELELFDFPLAAIPTRLDLGTARISATNRAELAAFVARFPRLELLELRSRLEHPELVAALAGSAVRRVRLSTAYRFIDYDRSPDGQLELAGGLRLAP